ncbi:hypothetical protein AB0532_004331 [Vibrio parahaemolyticus]
MKKLNGIELVAIILVVIICFACLLYYLLVGRPQGVVEEMTEQRDSLNVEYREKMAKIFAGDVSKFLLYSRLSEAVYEENSGGKLEGLMDGYSFDESNLVKTECLKIQAGINEIERHVVIVFRGTVPECAFNIEANIEQAILGDTEIYKESRGFVQSIKNSYPGYRFTLTGHSLGGGLAINNGIAFGSSDVYTFNTAFPNSFGVENAQLEKWTVENVRNNQVERASITNIVIEGDEIINGALFKFHGLVGNTYMLYHDDVPSRGWFDHPIKEIVYKLEMVNDFEDKEKDVVGYNSFIGSKMVF